MRGGGFLIHLQARSDIQIISSISAGPAITTEFGKLVASFRYFNEDVFGSFFHGRPYFLLRIARIYLHLHQQILYSAVGVGVVLKTRTEGLDDE